MTRAQLKKALKTLTQEELIEKLIEAWEGIRELQKTLDEARKTIKVP